jgi:hypothetical protein
MSTQKSVVKMETMDLEIARNEGMVSITFVRDRSANSINMGLSLSVDKALELASALIERTK